MIELVIPTFKRLDRQITFSNIPNELLNNVTLVVFLIYHYQFHNVLGILGHHLESKI